MPGSLSPSLHCISAAHGSRRSIVVLADAELHADLQGVASYFIDLAGSSNEAEPH